MYLVTSEQMRCFDHDTIETHRVPAIVLMDHAGRAVADSVLKRRPKSVIVICGKGNNGADGWLAARWLVRAGCDVHVLSTVDPATLQNDAFTAFRIADAAGIEWTVYQQGMVSQRVSAMPQGATVLVDAVLGTGVSRPLENLLRALVEEVNATGLPVIAVDVPTGVDASTGEIMGFAVAAVETVAMAFEKVGTAVTPGALHAGEVHVADIGIVASEAALHVMYTSPGMFGRRYGQRGQTSHKGTYGRCGIWAGEMTGAARLAAGGAIRSGAGLAIVRTESPVDLPPDVVVRRNAAISEAFADCRSVVIGPGLGTSSANVVEDLLDFAQVSDIRGVIDADGLRAIRRDGAFRHVGDDFVLTPHPKEAAQLLDSTTESVQARRLDAASRLSRETGAVVLLKGYRTIVASPTGTIRVNPTGDASLAVGGSGDVLAGVIGGLMAQGLDAFDAAALGAWLHGTAGEIAGRLYTPVSTMASDIVECLPKAVAAYLDLVK